MKKENNYLCEIKVKYSVKLKKADRKTINSSADIIPYLKQIYDIDTLEMREDFYLICLNRANEIIGHHKISSGGVSGTVVDMKIIFSIAVKSLASGIILTHNHPSGGLQPSSQDISLTKKVKECASIFDMSLLDHIIYTKESYLSFADESIL